MARKTELKQKQSQKVVVNINTEKRKKRSKPKATDRQRQVPQTISQVVPYLGLQSANNAQLLNSLQNSLNLLYSKNQTVKAPAGSGFATVLAPPPAAPITSSFPSLRPPPTPATVPLTAPAPAPALMPPPPPPLPLPAPTAAPLYPKTRPPQRIPAEQQPAIGRTVREPVAQVSGPARAAYDLDTNKDGTVRKRGDKWKALPQEIRDLIVQEELSAKPVRAKLIKDEEDTDAEIVRAKPRRKKQPENIDVDKSVPIEDTNIKEIPKEKPRASALNEKANKVEKALLSQVLHTKTEIKPDPPTKTLISLLPMKSSKVAIAAGDETDYGDLLSESDSF